MTNSAKLSATPIVAFVPINDKEKALAFYRDQLGLTLLHDESPFALVFKVSGKVGGDIMLRATFAGDFKPQPFTILGWQVEDIETAVTELIASGVTMSLYPGLNDSHPLNIWTAPGGARIGWFQDPFGNTLSVSQHPKS